MTATSTHSEKRRNKSPSEIAVISRQSETRSGPKIWLLLLSPAVATRGDVCAFLMNHCPENVCHELRYQASPRRVLHDKRGLHRAFLQFRPGRRFAANAAGSSTQGSHTDDPSGLRMSCCGLLSQEVWGHCDRQTRTSCLSPESSALPCLHSAATCPRPRLQKPP